MAEALLMNPGGKKITRANRSHNMKGEKTMAKHYKLKDRVGLGRPLAGHMYKGNPYMYPTYRPFGGPSILRNPVAALKANLIHPITMDSFYGLLTASVGAIGTYAIPTTKLVKYIPVIGKMRIVNLLLSNTINMTALATVARMTFKHKPEVAKNVLIGGLTMTGLQLFGLLAMQLPNVQVLQKVSPATALAGLGTSQSEALRSKIEEAVRKLGQPESASMVSTVGGCPAAVTAFETVGQPRSASSFVTVGDGDGLTEDNLN